MNAAPPLADHSTRDTGSAVYLLLEEIGVGSGTDQAQFVSLDAVNQEPIRLDVSLPVTLPDAPQWMIEIACGQKVLLD